MRWPAVFVPLLLWSCSSDEPAAPATQVDDVDYELQEWTTVLPQEVLDAIVSKDDAQGTIRFRGAPEIVRNREPGDVIIGGKSAATPRGFVRAVVSVKPEGEDTVVETMPVPLPLAFKRLHAKIAPRVVDYLKTPPSAAELKTILKILGLKPRDLMRKGEPRYAELGLKDRDLDDDALIALMVANPILIERQIVVSRGKAALGRPPESVLEIL